MRRPERIAIIRRAAALGMLAVALVALLGACSTAPYKGLTKAEFLRQANQPCTHPSKQGKDLRDLLAVQLVPERKAKIYLEKVLPLFDKQVDRIAELKPPKADRDQVKKIIDETRADSKEFAKRLQDDPKTTLAAAGSLFEKSSASARSYGLKICAD